ncbi:hypothetical protein MD484_g7104, partial [Candolleomyces efflorescens]
MDSFTTIKPTHIPTDAEGGGTSGSGGYCVIFAKEKEIPADQEGGGTSGSGGYCVVFNKDIPAEFEGGVAFESIGADTRDHRATTRYKAVGSLEA